MKRVGASKATLYPKRSPRSSGTVFSIMFIDPGLDGTGWAYWRTLDTGAGRDRATLPEAHGVIRPSRKHGWQSASLDVCAAFAGVLLSIKPKNIVIEFPELWASSAVSYASTARGELFKVAYLVGGLAEVGSRNKTNLPVLISPSEWKGQLKKDAMVYRIKRLFDETPEFPTNEHTLDAVGMGIAAQGAL